MRVVAATERERLERRGTKLRWKARENSLMVDEEDVGSYLSVFEMVPSGTE